MSSVSPRSNLYPALVVAAASAIVTLLLGLLARRAEPDPVSTPLIDADGRLYYLIALASAVGLAVVAVARGIEPAPGARAHDWRAGIVPGFALLAGALLLVWRHDGLAMLLIALAVGAASFSWLALAQLVDDRAQRDGARALMAAAALYFLLAVMLSFRTRALYGGTASGMAVALALLASQGIRIDSARVARAAGVGLVVAELVWALNYLNLSYWVAALPVTGVALISAWLIQRDDEGSHSRPEVAAPQQT